MYQRWHIYGTLLCFLLLLCACGGEPRPTPIPTATPPPDVSQAEDVAREYLRAWQEGAYDRMYALLSIPAQATISADRFAARYRAIAAEATITGLTASVTNVQRVLTDTAEITFTLTVDTQFVGQFQSVTALDLSYDGQRWLVDWTPEAIFPLLLRDNLVHMFIHVPSRGSIYDRRDLPLATDARVIEIGVVPGEIKDEAQLLRVLNTVLGLPPATIQARYAGAGRPDWFMPIGELTPEAAERNKQLLSSVTGIAQREKAVRAYPQGSLAAQVVGYMAEIDAPTLARLGPQGYREGDRLGVSGLEGWSEKYLGGTRGGTLAIISSAGRIVWTLAGRPAEESYNLYTTLDLTLQRAVESILGQNVGAIVVLDVRNGEVLALANHPVYDPNVFISGSTEQRQALLNDPQRPFLNRTLLGIYPPGSTFKIVTMAAGMEELGLPSSQPYYCAGPWHGLVDATTRFCWQKSGHGRIDLLNGLAQSCDTVFWEVGKALNERDPYALPLYARAFGLGATTGLNALIEAAGLIPDPEWKARNYSGAEQEWLLRDAVNMAIGQGDVLATPLQMANLVAAVANGGTLYRTRLLRRMVSQSGQEVHEFGLEILGQLPVSAATLQVVRRGMQAVVSYGTASRAFAGATIAMAGKSGTSEAPPGEPHAWFVGYAPASDPQIAVAVVLEHGGEGGANAAPLFRRVVEAYMASAR